MTPAVFATVTGSPRVTSAQKVSANSRLRLLIQAFSFSIRKNA
jgi:hypothetical protein